MFFYRPLLIYFWRNPIAIIPFAIGVFLVAFLLQLYSNSGDNSVIINPSEASYSKSVKLDSLVLYNIDVYPPSKSYFKNGVILDSLAYTKVK